MDYRFTDLVFEVKDATVWGTNDNTIILTVNVPYQLKYVEATDITEAPEDFHIFTMINNGSGDYKILTHNPAIDSFSFDFANVFKANSMDLEKTTSYIIDDAKVFANEVRQSALFQNEERKAASGFVNIPDSPPVRAYSSRSYNRSNAASYALQYAKSYNSAYGTPMTADCTNFASQCLSAGGFPEDDTQGVTDKQFYWNSRSDNSYSWKNAHGLYVYLTTNGGSSSVYGAKNVTTYTSSLVGYLSNGDIVSYFSSGLSGSASHSAVVSGALTSNGLKIDLLLCQHSLSPYYNVPLSNNNGSSPKRGLVINGYYS